MEIKKYVICVCVLTCGISTNLWAFEDDDPLIGEPKKMIESRGGSITHDTKLAALYKSFLVGKPGWKNTGPRSYVYNTIDIVAFDVSASGVVVAANEDVNASDVVVKSLYPLSYEKTCTAQFQSIKKHQDSNGYVPHLSYELNGGKGCVSAPYFLSVEPIDKYRDRLYHPSTLNSEERKLLKYQDGRAVVYVKGEDKIVISFSLYVTRIKGGKVFELFSGYDEGLGESNPSLGRELLYIARNEYVADLDDDGNIELLINSGNRIYADTSINEIVNHERDELFKISWADEEGNKGYNQDYSTRLLKKH
jgi:hypothetical protein